MKLMHWGEGVSVLAGFESRIPKSPRGWCLCMASALLLTGCSADRESEPASKSVSLPLQGPVAAYAFDESSGSSISDSSGNGHNSTLNGQSRVLGRYGGALQFENSFLTVADSALLDLTTQMTLSAWVKLENDENDWPTVLLKEDESDLAYALYAGRPRFNPPLAFITAEHFATESERPIPVGSWTHFAATYNGSTMKVYLNGELRGSSTVAAPIPATSHPLRIGGNDIWDEEFFHGKLDEIRIYNRALSQAEIQYDMYTGVSDSSPSAISVVAPANGDSVSSLVNAKVFVRNPAVARVQFLIDGTPTDPEDTAAPFTLAWNSTAVTNGTHTVGAQARNSAGTLLATSTVTVTVNNALVAAYGFDEGSGSTIADASGYDHDATLDGQTWVSGKFGSALRFNGNLISIADSDLLDLRTGMTLSAWVKPLADQNDWTTIVMKEGYGELLYALYGGRENVYQPSAHVTSEGDYFDLFAEESGEPIALGNWMHLATTYDGTALRMYVNGDLESSTPVDAPISVSSGPLSIGGNNVWEDEFFRGAIDELRVYNRALSENEIEFDMHTAVNDVSPAAISLINPENGERVSSLVRAEVFVRNPAVTRVKFLVDGAPFGSEDTSPPFATAWNSTSVANGSHTIAAEGRNAAGTLLGTSSVAVTVNNALVAAYSFNEGTGSALTDATGNGHNGTLNGQSWVQGKFCGGLQFDNNFVVIDDSQLLDLKTGMTLSAWVKPLAQQGDWPTVVAKAGHTQMVYSLLAGRASALPPRGRVSSGGVVYVVEGDADSFGPIGTWTHLAATYDGAALRFYINGELSSSTPFALPISVSARPLSIGGIPGLTTKYFRGVIDELRLYNRALSESEIDSDMITPLGGGCCSGSIDDGNPCTADACDPIQGTVHTPVVNGTPCPNNTICDGAETCQSGTCVAGTPPVVNDGNACTTDACHPVNGVTHTAVSNGTPCPNGTVCDGAETCQSGNCASGTPPALSDGNPCTLDVCNPITGVSHPPSASGTPCSDGNACNGSETCNGAGSCVPGTPPELNDGNPCTADACNPATGVSHTPVAAGTPCPDNDVCNGVEACNANGSCSSPGPLNCNDGNACTTDSCAPSTGCLHALVPACDGAPNAVGGAVETRASLLCKVTHENGAAVSGYTVSVFDDGSSTPRSDTVISTASDGSFRARLTAFPTAPAVDSPPQRVLLRVSHPNHPTLTRSAYLRAGDVFNLGSCTLLDRDPNVTTIGPGGGTASDSGGHVQLIVPPGAVSSPVDIRITPIDDRAHFPSPLPPTTYTGYGVVFEPEGVEFAQPVQVRITNDRNFPTGLCIPCGRFDPSKAEWVHTGTATWNGQVFSGTILRTGTHDWNPAQPNAALFSNARPILAFSDDADPLSDHGSCGDGAMSALPSGSIGHSLTLGSYVRKGQSHSVTLRYGSASATTRLREPPSGTTTSTNVLAAFTNEPAPFSLVRTPGTHVSDRVGAGCSTAICDPIPASSTANLYRAEYCILGSCRMLSGALSGSEVGLQLPANVPLPGLDGTIPRAQYVPFRYSLTLTRSQSVLGSCGTFGVSESPSSPLTMTGVESGPAAVITGYEFVPHRRGSPFGNGWAVSELAELHRAPDGSRADRLLADCVETFRRRPKLTTLKTGMATTLGRPQTRDPLTGEILIATASNGSIVRLESDLSLTTVLSGLNFGSSALAMAIGRVGGDRRFLVLTSNALLEVSSSGSQQTLATFSTIPTPIDAPAVAALNESVYYTTRADDRIRRIRLDDPARTPVPITAGPGGDVRIDPTGPASGVSFRRPRGLAVGLDGSLYVATPARHMVYRLLPETAGGQPGPASAVERVAGNGMGSFIDVLHPAPAREFGLLEPLFLAATPEGGVVISTAYGAALYDPAQRMARWLALDQDHIVDSPITIDIDFTHFSNLLPLTNGSFLTQNGTTISLVETDEFVSRLEPTRRVVFSSEGATITDSTSNIEQIYTWVDATKTLAVLTLRRSRTGETLLAASYVSGSSRPAFIEDASGGRSTFEYDGAGKIQRIVNPAGQATDFVLDSNGDLHSVTTPLGTSTLTYSQHRLTSVVSPHGGTTAFNYSSNGNAASTTSPTGAATTYQSAPDIPSGTTPGTYSAAYTDARGVPYNTTLDASGQISAATFTADGVAYNLQRTRAAPPAPSPPPLFYRYTLATLNGVQVTPTSTWDQLGRLQNVTSAPGLFSPNREIARFNFAADGQVSKITPGETFVEWSFERDTSGRLTKLFDIGHGVPTGRETLFTWRPDNLAATSTMHGVTTTYTYDPNGNPLTASDTLGRSMASQHDAAGNLTLINDGTTFTQFAYDSSNRMQSSTDATGNVTSYTYDPGRDLISTQHTPDLPGSSNWSYSYDASGALTSTTNPEDETTNITHFSTGEVQTITDALGRTSTFGYDQLGRPKTAVDAAGRVAAVVYPVPNAGVWVGNEVFAQSPDGTLPTTNATASLRSGETQFGTAAHQPGGFPSRIEFYRDATFELSYGKSFDAQQRLLERKQRLGLPTTSGAVFPPSGVLPLFNEQFGYELHTPFPHLRSHEADSDPSGFQAASFELNQHFEIATMQGWTGFGLPIQSGMSAPNTLIRDTGGRLTQANLRLTKPLTASQVPIDYTNSFTYQPNGQIQRIVNVGATRDFTYDGRGYVHTMTVSFQFVHPTNGIQTTTEGTFSYEYDGVGRNTLVTHPDGHQRAQQYDGAGRLTSRCYTYAPPVAARCYTAEYDAAGNPTRLTDPEGETTVEYDLLDRILEVRRVSPGEPDSLETYEYNALGALSVHAGAAVDHQRPRLDGTGVAASGVPATHNGLPVNLNSAGYVTRIGNATLDYSPRGRLIRVLDGTIREEYGFDPFLRRIQKLRGGPNGQLELYVYDDTDLETTDVRAEPSRNIVAVLNDFGIPGVRKRFVFDGVDQPLWMYDADQRATVYYELDAIGNVRRLRGGRRIGGGTAIPSDLGGYRYSAFGRLVPPNAATPAPTIPHPVTGAMVAFEQPLRWQGRWFTDVAGGLYEFRARVWSPELGIFTAVDEFDKSSLDGTLWSWPGQNPMAYRDPSGHDFSLAGTMSAGQIVGIFAAMATFSAMSAYMQAFHSAEILDPSDFPDIPKPLDVAKELVLVGWKIGGLVYAKWVAATSLIAAAATSDDTTNERKCVFVRRHTRTGDCDVCEYKCPGYGAPVTFPQDKDLECPGITPGGLVDTSQIGPKCRY